MAWRSLRRSPAFAATAILTLAIGIGGSTAVFSVVHAVLWRPLPFEEPNRLVRLWESHPSDGRTQAGVAPVTARDWLARSSVLDDIALFEEVAEPVVLGVPAVRGDGTAPLQAKHAAVTPNFFALLGVQPVAGRLFTTGNEPDDGTGREVILSHGFWRRTFSADRGVIGRPVSLEGRAGGVVVGVLPDGFTFPLGVEVWTSLVTRGVDRASRDFGAVGRVKATMSVDAARADLQSIATALTRDYAATNTGWTVEVRPLLDSVAGSHRLGLLTLLAAVTFVVLVGCANLSNLLLARGMARQRELAVRMALGASRFQVTRLLLAESLLIAMVGGVAGWFIAAAMLPLLLQFVDASIPRVVEARLNVVVLLYCAGAIGASTILAGFVPALRLSRPHMQAATCPSSERVTGWGAEARLQRVLVAGELAACLVLLIGALLLTQTMVRLNAVPLGFDPAHVVTIDARMPLYRTLDPNRWQRLATDTSAVLHRLRATAGVDAASATSDPPLSGHLQMTDITFPGDARVGRALYHRVGPEYFRTLGMTFVQGRDFTDDDASDLARLPDPRLARPRPGAAIVNETAARAYWPSGNALGQFLSTSFDARVVSRRQVVGVVRDAVSETLRKAPPLEVYIPFLEDPSFATTLLVRTVLPMEQIAPVLRREILAATVDMSIADIRPLNEVVQQSMATPRFGAVLVSTFAGVALLLAAVGVYGVCAFGVSVRIREIGIRLALGATRRNIVVMFLSQAAGPIGWGLAVGAAGAMALSRLVATLLFGVAVTDAVIVTTAVGVLVVVALAASYLPVRRALRRSTVDALR